MKPIYVNKSATITEGILAGISGRVVGADSEEGRVDIEVEEGTYASISRDKVTQEL